ncbi:helix-turn-helix transcriptional regulator [Variovorax paradoxus]|uniref:HTH-type transcriptional activator RhaR n=1 Tax=Variovorax paradoxus TaxID=34073 RepID=A0A0H2M3B8_VARPD|nr:AraC family transcriptional regulator [Variovorax paradoxus]KLN55257.1 HTH-type transcriptional activator RhaR [Variovorax paradoxus]
MARSDPRNTSRYWHAPGVRGLDLLHADFTTHDYAPHVHDSLVVAVTEVGGSEFKSRGRTDIAHEQALLVFNPCEPHSGRMGGSKRWRYRSFYLAEPGIKDVLTSLGIDQPRHFTANVFRDPDLVARFLALHRALAGEPDPLLHQELLVRGFGALFRRHAEAGQRVPVAPADARLLAPVLELMRDCHAERLTLEQMGQVADLTTFQLIGMFNRLTGLTPHTYLTQLRLRAAIRQLDAGQSVADAALASGFYDQSALNKHFKRTFGMTPLQYVRALTS